MTQIPVKFKPYEEHDDIEDYFERFEFFLAERDQHPGEPIKEFLIELRQLAHTCNFGNFLE